MARCMIKENFTLSFSVVNLNLENSKILQIAFEIGRFQKFSNERNFIILQNWAFPKSEFFGNSEIFEIENFWKFEFSKFGNLLNIFRQTHIKFESRIK